MTETQKQTKVGYPSRWAHHDYFPSWTGIWGTNMSQQICIRPFSPRKFWIVKLVTDALHLVVPGPWHCECWLQSNRASIRCLHLRLSCYDKSKYPPSQRFNRRYISSDLLTMDHRHHEKEVSLWESHTVANPTCEALFHIAVCTLRFSHQTILFTARLDTMKEPF